MGLTSFASAVGLAALVVFAPSASRAQTVEAVRAAGRLSCGAVEAVDDWDGLDQHGDISSLGREICRAVATAVLGAPDKLEPVTFPAELDALAGLQAGRVQVAVGVTPGIEAATRFGVGFGPVVFYDTYRLMALQARAFASAADLRDKLICVMDGSEADRSLRDEMGARGIPYALQAHSEQGEMDESVAVARCTAGYALESRLADSRSEFPAGAPAFTFLPERFGLVPAAAAIRYGDQRFGLIVAATVDALIEAEALGITQANVEASRARTDVRARLLLGGDFAVGQALGLDHDWAAQVIAAVGNYGEIFDRTLGKTYRLERGPNALWTAGGLMRPGFVR